MACTYKSVMRKVGQRMSQRGVPVVCCAVCAGCQQQWTDGRPVTRSGSGSAPSETA